MAWNSASTTQGCGDERHWPPALSGAEMANGGELRGEGSPIFLAAFTQDSASGAEFPSHGAGDGEGRGAHGGSNATDSLFLET